MSDERFAEFSWPIFKELTENLVDADVGPRPLLEDDCTPRLKFLAELQPGKVAAHYDHIGRRRIIRRRA
jgi:hypothetical protein